MLHVGELQSLSECALTRELKGVIADYCIQTFFSFGHSSLVIGVTIAIIVSVSTIDKLPSVASVGGVIGERWSRRGASANSRDTHPGISVSASLLLLLALINSVFLFSTLRTRRLAKRTSKNDDVEAEAVSNPVAKDADVDSIAESQGEKCAAKETTVPVTTCLGRVVRPIVRLVDEPWKVFDWCHSLSLSR